MILDLDVAFAVVTAMEKLMNKETSSNCVYILGGGKKNGFQITGEALISRTFDCFSLPRPDAKYFTTDLDSYHLDWYDTKIVQQEFNYQNHKLEDYFIYLKKRYGRYRIFICLFKRIILRKLTSMSPYYENIN